MMESAWGPTSISNKPDEYSSSEERAARSVALEKAYVHDVYQQIACHFTDSRYHAWPRVKQFLLDLEPGSVVCDVGCGNGKYLSFNPSVYKIGLDRCSNLTGVAREKEHEVLVCDNLALPFRDECFDAVLSVAVIHHFATTERRVAALQELARVLRIGGRLIISVWALEQRHRKFESQDVLVPWSCPITSSSDGKTSSIERDLNSTTTTTSDDDVTHYHAYTQTSDSDSFPSMSAGYRKRGRARHRGRSIDPTCPSSSQSSSDLSSPNESCYSFVRRALKKLAGTKRNRGGRTPWFFQGLDMPQQDGIDPIAAMEDDANGGLDFGNMNDTVEHLMPIELRQLESTDYAELLQVEEDGKKNKHRGMLFSNVLYPRRRTLEITGEAGKDYTSPMVGAQTKSKSLSDLFGLIPGGILRSARKSSEDLVKGYKGEISKKWVVRSQSSLSGLASPGDEIEFPDFVRHKAVQTCSLESIDVSISNAGDTSSSPCRLGASDSSGQFKSDSTSSSMDADKSRKKLRPMLVKQKHSICSSTSPQNMSSSSVVGEGSRNSIPNVPTIEMTEDVSQNLEVGKNCEGKEDEDNEEGGGNEDEFIPWGEIKQSVKDLPEFKQAGNVGNGTGGSNCLRVPLSHRTGAQARGTNLSGSSFWKQTSLNEELIFSERIKEKERLKQNIQKQCSLNEELIYKQRENTRWDQMKEAFLNSSNVKCLQLLKHGLSNRFRGNPTDSATSVDNHNNPHTVPVSQASTSPFRHHYQASTSLKNGLVRMLQTWKQSEDSNVSGVNGNTHSQTFLNSRRGSKEGAGGRRGLFPPFFLRRSSAGSLNVNKTGNDHGSASQVLSPPPYLMRRPSENELIHDGLVNGNGNKLLPGVRHVRKLSREEGSDSSKDSSFQSDTSVDSEDSFASVIFIPKNTSLDNPVGPGDPMCFNSETRANSTDSDRSPKSPASRLSPLNPPGPKSPSPLAKECLRRKSPEVSPTRFTPVYSGPTSAPSTYLETTKFLFDESATNFFSNLTNTNPCELSGPSFKEDTILSIVAEEEPLVQPIGISTTEIFNPGSVSFVPNTYSNTSTKLSSSNVKKTKVEKIEVLRKPAVLPELKSSITRQLVRRSLPKSLAVELFNPETDDADTSDTSSSSPESVSSVVSVVNEEQAQVVLPVQESVKEGGLVGNSGGNHGGVSNIATVVSSDSVPKFPETDAAKAAVAPPTKTEGMKPANNEITCGGTPRKLSSAGSVGSPRKLSSAGILEAAAHVVSSLENLVTNSSPKSRKRFNMAKLDGMSEWLSSLPSEASGSSSSGASSHQASLKRQPSDRRTSGEKMLIGEVKKLQSKGHDTKWPASIIDESPPQTAKLAEDDTPHPISSSQFVGSVAGTSGMQNPGSMDYATKLADDLEEKDSLYDSMENLTNNPSIDSSVRMSSTCSCSIRGGDSFDSWTSAKSSLTNSSSTHNNNRISCSSLTPLQIPVGKATSLGGNSSSSGGGGSHRVGCSSGSTKKKGPGFSKTSHVAGDSEDSTALTYHRYYHVFREGELDRLIEKYVQNLHIISSYYDHANWCIIAEKVQVWTI